MHSQKIQNYILLQFIHSRCVFTCAGEGRVEGQDRVAPETWATSLAPASDSVVSALVTNAPRGPAGGEPRPPREVTAVSVAVALALWTQISRGVMRNDEPQHIFSF